jgi:fructose-specific phosphotransferase system IIA component
MDFLDYNGPYDLNSENRWEAIEELIDQLVANRQIKPEHRDAVLASVNKRESSMTTGIGDGIGMPHATTDLVGDLVVAIGRSRKGIQFDSLDGKPVNIVILFLVPQSQFQKHLHTMANIAKLMHSKKFRDGLWGGGW